MNEVNPAAPPASHPASMGSRLRAGRESLGLTAAETAVKLRISLAIVEAMERDDLSRLGAPVYARGYLASYARLVDVPTLMIDSALREQEAPLAPLHSAAYQSRGRFLVDRYARRAASIVLTASIVIPVVWLATEERLPVQPSALRSLDVTTIGSGQTGVALPPAASDATLTGPPDSLAGAPARVASTSDDTPVMASFAPFLSARPAPSADPVLESGWTLRFKGDSWVEIIDREGRRLDFGVIPAGSERHYPAGSVAKVAIGNAGVVEVLRDGEAQSLAPFQRANVARFAVSSAGELTPAGG